jgi:quinol monooxygenase YgiN
MPKRKAKKMAARARRKRSSSRTGKLPKEAVTLIVILRAREGQDVLLEAELRALIAPTRREDGCLTYDLHRSTEIPGTFLLHEVWASREHHRLHTSTPHFLRWNARKDALLAARDATFWTQVA